MTAINDSQIFNHNTPQAPTLSAGAWLGASGVNHAVHHLIGSLSGNSSANGSFSGEEGYGHIDYAGDYLYVFDSGNSRIQRFALSASGVFTYDSKLDNVPTLVGGGSATYGVMAIDRSRSQIHITLGDYTQTTGSWISVWNLSDWPNLTTGNRVRQYGSNSAASDASGRSFLGLSLAIDDTYAIVSSALSPFRLLRWNHVDGTLANQTTKGATVSQFVTDGAGNWWAGAHSGADIIGLRSINPATFASIARLDTASANQLRLGQFSSASAGQRPFYHDGRIYARDSVGLVTAWNAVSNAVVDVFLSPGALGPSNALSGGHSPSHNIAAVIYRDKGRAVVIGDKAFYVTWAHNANSTAVQAFLAVYPMTTSVATWTKSDWSAGVNTIKSISVKGTNLGGEKYKIRIRKNAGAWLTVTSDLLQDEATFAALTFTDGDTMTLELSQSTWDRLDGHAQLIATRDKLSPTNVAVKISFLDDAAINYTPYPSSANRVRISMPSSVRVRNNS